MTKNEFIEQKEEILLRLEQGFYLKLSETRINQFKLIDGEGNPVYYYPIRIFNNLIDEKRIVNVGGKFILSNQNQ